MLLSVVAFKELARAGAVNIGSRHSFTESVGVRPHLQNRNKPWNS